MPINCSKCEYESFDSVFSPGTTKVSSDCGDGVPTFGKSGNSGVAVPTF